MERGSLRSAGDGESRISGPLDPRAAPSGEARTATAKPSDAAHPRLAPIRARGEVQPAREDDPLAEAKRLGEVEAELADLRLRLKESLARERRLLETTIEFQEALEQTGRVEYDLRLQIERYAAYHRAVERSSAWRLVQFLRSLVGRKW